MSRRCHLLYVVLVLSSLHTASVGHAQEDQKVKWRFSYLSARKEAQEKGLPLLLDFGTHPCVWCDKLDATTFRDARVVGLVNQQFIPLRIDGEKQARLSKALRIHSYPTLVFASPEGKILKTVPGYRNASQMYEILNRLAASTSSPQWMRQAYDVAIKQLRRSEFAPAIASLRRITDAGGSRPVQSKASKLLNELEARVRKRLTKAEELHEKGETKTAMKLLTATLRDYSGLDATKKASTMLASLARIPDVRKDQRLTSAQTLLAQAKRFYQTKDYIPCIHRCETLMEKYADLPEGRQAIVLAKEIKADPEWLQKACDQMSDRLGAMYIDLAESYLKRGQPQRAIGYLERVVQAFPGTRQAVSAQLRLSQLQGQPTQRVEFQTPAP